MKNLIKKTKQLTKETNVVFLIKDIKALKDNHLSLQEKKYIQRQKKLKKNFFSFNRFNHWLFVQFLSDEKDIYKELEENRRSGNKLQETLNDYKTDDITIYDLHGNNKSVLSYLEGIALGNYQFIKYLNKTDDRIKSLKDIRLFSDNITSKELIKLNIILESTFICRDMVNEPVSFMNAGQFVKEIQSTAIALGLKVEVMNKKKIESLKMGGLLAVNKGSIDPPFFVIIEWKPDDCVNKDPYVFVGKGIVYDTGGLNIKTGKNMEDMKADMAGAAAVASSIFAIAKSRLPVHIVGLIPVTDNRPNANAYASGDVIRMFDGSTVEIINTDAEGRMILADALSYAKKYNPQLVIDIATLTGSAIMAIGNYGIVAMESKADREYKELEKSGLNVYERLVQFPFWDEYKDDLKSDIADIKNLGESKGGAIKAGKFLEHFTDYPYIHLDIAGPAFLNKKDSYRGSGGTGTCVRLLFDFISGKV